MNDNEAIIVKMQYENRLSHFTGGKLEDFVAIRLEIVWLYQDMIIKNLIL